MDTDVLLHDLNEIQWDVNIFNDDGQIQTIQGIDANLPQASAYIFSVVPPGPLPKQFWQGKQYSLNHNKQYCSIFKVTQLCLLNHSTFSTNTQVLYHFHLSLSGIPDNPQDTLR